MGELAQTRLGVWFRLACGAVALGLCAIPWSHVVRAWFGMSLIVEQPSNYFFAGIASGTLGMLAPHFVMKPGLLKLWRRVALAFCLLVLLLNAASLAIIAVLSSSMSL